MEYISEDTLNHFNLTKQEFENMKKIYNEVSKIAAYSRYHDLNKKNPNNLLKFHCEICNHDYYEKYKKKHLNSKKHIQNLNIS